MMKRTLWKKSHSLHRRSSTPLYDLYEILHHLSVSWEYVSNLWNDCLESTSGNRGYTHSIRMILSSKESSPSADFRLSSHWCHWIPHWKTKAKRYRKKEWKKKINTETILLRKKETTYSQDSSGTRYYRTNTTNTYYQRKDSWQEALRSIWSSSSSRDKETSRLWISRNPNERKECDHTKESYQTPSSYQRRERREYREIKTEDLCRTYHGTNQMIQDHGSSV